MTTRPVIIAKVTTKDGCREEAARIFRDAVAATGDEPGTTVCRMFLDRRDADVIWFYDEYADDDAMDAHVTNPARAVLDARIAHLLAYPPQTSFVELVVEK